MSDQLPPTKDLTPEEKRRLLSQLLEKKARGDESTYPLSYAQQAMWFLYELAPESSAYNTGFAARILGDVDLSVFQQSFADLVGRHPCLRTTFIDDSQKLAQQVHAHHDLQFEDIDAYDWDETRLFDEVMETLRRPFDLKQGPMLRVSLFTKSPTERVFLVAVHHIVVDGRSVRILLNEFLTLYNNKKSGITPLLPPLQKQFASYVQWERELVNGPVGDRHWEYWHEKLAGELPVLNLATDRPRPAIQSYHGSTQPFTVDKQLTHQIRSVAQANSVTLYMLLLAVFQALLHRYTHQEDFLVGSAVAETGQTGFADIVGYMVNVVALRTNIPDGLSFRELLSQTRQTVLEMLEHKDFPFPLLVERLKPERDPSRTPVYQVLFDLQKVQRSESMAALLNPEKENNRVEFGSLTLEPLWIPVQEGLVDLSLQVVETDEVLWGNIKYNTDLFDASTIARMSRHFLTLLAGIVNDPDERISNLPLLTSVEQQQILVQWNDTAAEYPNDKSIHELFEAQVEQTPEAIAVSYEDRQLTYRTLNAKANQLAHYLQSLGVGSEVLVGLCVNRSPEMIVGLLAILKAGGAYVPLDPTYPRERLSYMLEDAQVQVLLTQSDLRPIFPNYIAQVVCLDTDWDIINNKSQKSPVISTTPDDLAYVIYTSGSTGRPKGVLLTHRGLTNVSEAQVESFGLGTGDHVLQFSSLNFDASTFEIFMALRVGATLHLGSKESLQAGPPLAQFIKDNTITVVTLPPSVLALLPDEDFPALATINVAGEACSAELASRWAANHRFYNLYGPTESTIWATISEYKGGGKKPPIGRPICNIKTYVLDSHLQPVPIGVPGELHIGGVGLARGYLNRPDLTAEKFISDPFSNGSGQVLYKTGDLVRYLENGEIEFLGRIDHQVKIRGFRVELGEIESVLEEHPAVLDAEVIVQEKELIGKQIVAYIVLRHGSDSIRSELQPALKEKLPEHMIPSAFVLLDKLPLTPSGKVDRKALPEPDFSSQQTEYVAPRTPTEMVLCEIWQQLLGVERVGVTDNFFHLGGHSLLATRLASQINQQFNVALPLKTVFAEQTLEHLAQAIQRLDTGLDRPPLVRVPREGPLLPSYAQQRLWLLDQIDGGSAHYNISGGLRLSGELDPGSMNRAFTTILERHESLRTCFAAGEDGQPYQVIQAARPFVVAVKDVSHLTKDIRLPAIDQLMDEESHRTFDLRSDLMLRAQLLKVSATGHILLVTMHHIASDGWSITVLINEFNALYSAYTQGRQDPLPLLEIQYVDYAHWQRNWLQGEVLDQQLHYWEQQLAGLPFVHSLPLDHPRPQLQSFAGHTFRSQIDLNTTRSLNALCQTRGATLFMGLHAAFSTLISRYSNETDIVLGSPIANREQAEIAGLIGFFVNTLVLRSDLSNNPSFIELLDQSKRTLLDAYAHQQVPFEQIVERLQPERSLGYSPLFQVMLVLQNNERGTLSLPGLTLSPMEQTSAAPAKFDLTVYVNEGMDGLQLDWEYNTDLFDESTIQRMADHFRLLLTSLLQAPQENVFKASMLSDAEQHQLLMGWNDTTAEYPSDKCIHELFEEQAAIHPQATAVVFEDRQATFAELNTKANQLAHYLITEKHVTPDTPVGICIGRSIDMVVAILGILKAGGAYVPLDPDYPQARLAYMLTDASLSTVITHSHLLDRVPVSSSQAVCLDDADVQRLLAEQPSGNPSPRKLGLMSRNLAYVIYTSGSTGNPKGVQAPHASILNRVNWLERKFPASPEDVFCQKTAAGFVDHVAEIFQALAYGRPLIIVSTHDTLDPDTFVRIVKQHKITRLTLVPSLLKHLVEQGALEKMTSLKLVISSGEALEVNESRRFYNSLPAAKLLNLYGSSEVGADVTAYWVEQVDERRKIPIGSPIDNIQLYIFNSQIQLVPQGMAGELHVGGAGLARGYINRPELTADKFIPNPFYESNHPNSSERLYKTGDLVRWLPDGNLEFLGRIDHQVKIRGFRIELNEIENVLSSHDHVKDAVVVTGESTNSDKHLVAYVVPSRAELSSDSTLPMDAPFFEQLRKHLSQNLPDYMVPSAFVVLDKLPLTPNGKVDRKALPRPDFSSRQAIYTAPRTETEKVLCDIWQQVLGVDRVGITDNFFQLGGHSLLATQVVSRIRQNLQVELPLRTLFEAPTPLGLDQHIKMLLRIKQDQLQAVSIYKSDNREEIQL